MQIWPKQFSIVKFWHYYTQNSKHLPMCLSQLLVAIYYLQISWYGMNLKLILGIFCNKRSWSMILSSWSCDFFWKCVEVCKFCTVLLPKFNHISCLKVDISGKKLCTRKYFKETSRDHIHGVIYRSHLLWCILNVSFCF